MSEPFDGHLDGEVTTLGHCWRIERRDGVVQGFTDHDRELVMDGTLFLPRTGFTASEARTSLGLGTDSIEVEGALASADISEADIVGGALDGAAVETLVVNWAEPTQFRRLRTAAISEIKRADGAFVATLESFGRQFDQRRGRLIRRECDAELGDARCEVDLIGGGHSASGAVVGVEPGGRIRVSGLDAFPAGWSASGRLVWLSGARAGLADRVMQDAADAGGRVLTLWPHNGAEPEAGDGFEISAGCDKAFATCRAKFGNALNFQGFPHLPGNDEAYAYVREDDAFDGGPVVP